MPKAGSFVFTGFGSGSEGKGSGPTGNFVDLTTNQSVSGTKVFDSIQGSFNPTNPTDLTTKQYVDAISVGGVPNNSISTAKLQSPSISGSVIATPGISQGNLLGGYVDLVNNQVISGTKIFQLAQGAGNPTNPLDLATKAYVDANTGGNSASISGLYIVAGSVGLLPYSRLLTAGSNITLIDNGPGGTFVINSSISGSSGGSSNSYFPSGW